MKRFTVVGLSPDLQQRIALHITAEDVDGAMSAAWATDPDLAIAAVFAGHLSALDRGTFAGDPR